MVGFVDLSDLDQLGEHHRLEQAARGAARAFRRRQVLIEIGQRGLALGNKALARQLAHRRQQAQIGDVGGADLAVDHHPARGGKVDHG